MNKTKLVIILEVTTNGCVTTKMTRCDESEYYREANKLIMHAKALIGKNKFAVARMFSAKEGVCFAYSYLDKGIFEEYYKKPVKGITDTR